MMRIRNLSILIIAVSSVFMFMACKLSVPIREMSNAKKGITTAQKVKADKYAPEELESAKKKLIESHDQISNKDVDNAKKSAEDSSSLSLAAYNKTLPLLAKDTISVAEKSMSEAADVYAERLAADEYRDAEDKLKQANDQFQNKQYNEAYESAVKADEKAKNARNTALGKKDVLRDSIVEVKRTLEEAEKYGAKKYASDKLNLANENVDVAEKAYDAQELKKGFSAIEVAKLNADEALLAALKNTAADRLAAAEKAVGQAEKSKFAAEKKAEMNAARESLENAKSKLADSKYKESIAASEEALRLSMLVMSKKVEGTEIAEGNDVNQQQQQQQQLTDEKDYFLYTVVWREKYKDCLWYIAKKYYKNGMLWKKIYQANKDQIQNPNLILPGWVLKVPKLKK
jgi:nucleoid-associated protein YgaU